MTKTFTATLAGALLGDTSALSLLDTFTDVDNSALGEVKLRDLRNHTAGLPRLSDQFAPGD